MFTASASTPMLCRTGPLAAIETDLLIVPWFQDDDANAISGIDAATGGALGRAIASKEFQPKPYELFITPVTDTGWRARRVAFIGGSSSERGSGLGPEPPNARGLRRPAPFCA